jgi:glycosyltransferase involved in cell wall biosynthesis
MKTTLVMHQGGNQIRGSEVCLIHTVNALLAANYKVILLRNNSIIDQTLNELENLEIADCDYPEIMIDGDHKSFPIFRYIRSFLSLRKFVKKYDVTRIVCNGGLPCQLGVPLGKSIGIPVLCHFHHPAAERYFYFWLVRFADHLIFPSKFTASIVAQKCGREGQVVYNAVDLDIRYVPSHSRDPRFRSELGIPNDGLVIGQVGALVPHKRPDFLIKAFAAICNHFPRVYLLLVGWGPMQESLRAEISRHQLDNRIKLIGYVDDVLPYLQNVIDINVLASAEEGLGISVIEAAGCSLPSVVSDCTGLKEVVVQNETGYKFSPNDNTELQFFLVKLIQDPALRIRLGKAAREHALKKFCLPRYSADIVSVIEQEF